MTRTLSDTGDVVVADSKEAVGRFPYRLVITEYNDGRIGNIRVNVGLDPTTAIKYQTRGAVLTLRLKDGSELDFFISRVEGYGDVIAFEASSALRPPKAT